MQQTETDQRYCPTEWGYGLLGYAKVIDGMSEETMREVLIEMKEVR